MPENAEKKRIAEGRDQIVAPWFLWGPYVSERSWGTVREDYSWDGEAWNYFPFEMASWRAFRWGEDGIAGWCDRYQIMVLNPVFWNEKDPILKERLFGLNTYEGNHGEDVKEYYFHLDGLPSHAYMKYLYKYPQEEYPYQKLREENARRTAADPEYELIDTGILNENRYFDIFIEYAKDSIEGLCIKIEAFNRGNQPAPLHILQQMVFRNQWSWSGEPFPRPRIVAEGSHALVADDSAMPSIPQLPIEYWLGKRYLYGPKGAQLLFTENDTRCPEPGHYKDAFHRAIVQKEEGVVNPKHEGSKAALHYKFDAVPAGESVKLLFRFSPHSLKDPLHDVERIIAERKEEADAFYASIHPKQLNDQEKMIQRQALAGIIWSKQIYIYDVNRWLEGDNPAAPPPASRLQGRNNHWRHLNSMRVLLMPDVWEYPWFAAWDLAFHCITYAIIDMEFAKKQLWLMLFDQFQHPNGQIPAYEWNFSDLNPPVQSWAALHLYKMELERTGKADRDFLERCFLKLTLNFTWWVNKVDNTGNNVFEGGFLGLDNITVCDRSEKFPSGVVLRQSDGTGWMAMFALNLMRMALELCQDDKNYEGMATKFFQHYVYIAHAMKKRGNTDYEMWSETDGFFYDVLSYPDGTFTKFRVRSLVGLIPLYAIEILHEDHIKQFPDFYRNFKWFMENRKDLVEPCIIPTIKNNKRHYVCTMMNHEQLQSVLKYIWNPEEFRATYGLRSLSRYHEKNPFEFQGKTVGYEPSDSLHKVKGGNSNWRGPIWMPTTYLLVDSLRKLTEAYEENIKITVGHEPPTDIPHMIRSFSERVMHIFLPNKEGKRPVFGPDFPFARDPHWRDYIPFNEFFNPETGKGLGSSHQTGWTALIANFMDDLYKKLD